MHILYEMRIGLSGRCPFNRFGDELSCQDSLEKTLLGKKTKRTLPVMKNEDKYSKCPIRHVLSLFSDKWSLLVLGNLYVKGNMRFGELASSMTDISERMLTVRLRNLERHNLIVRRTFREVPPRVEYSLSPLGESAMPHIEALFNWAKDHFDEIAGGEG